MTPPPQVKTTGWSSATPDSWKIYLISVAGFKIPSVVISEGMGTLILPGMWPLVKEPGGLASTI